jgi:hypothetical protein
MSLATIALEGSTTPVLMDDSEAADALMAVDWQVLGLTRRLAALERIEADTKRGMDWQGIEGMPSIKRLASWGDKLAALTLSIVGWGFDYVDRRAIANLRRAIINSSESEMVVPIETLANSAIVRGLHLGYAVPRVALLREVGFAVGNEALIATAALYLSELAHQYVEYAHTDGAVGRCYSVSLSFVIEAARFTVGDHGRISDGMARVLIASHNCGISAAALSSIRWK